MNCRIGCGACCIAASITSPIPGMPQGKPAGVRCVNLDRDNLCRIWNTPDYPPVCRDFIADPEVCGESQEEALATLAVWEELTRPAVGVEKRRLAGQLIPAAKSFGR